MARIMKSTPRKSTVEQIFNLYICSVTSEGVKDKTITTYKQHFHAKQQSSQSNDSADERRGTLSPIYQQLHSDVEGFHHHL